MAFCCVITRWQPSRRWMSVTRASKLAAAASTSTGAGLTKREAGSAGRPDSRAKGVAVNSSTERLSMARALEGPPEATVLQEQTKLANAFHPAEWRLRCHIVALVGGQALSIGTRY